MLILWPHLITYLGMTTTRTCLTVNETRYFLFLAVFLLNGAAADHAEFSLFPWDMSLRRQGW